VLAALAGALSVAVLPIASPVFAGSGPVVKLGLDLPLSGIDGASSLPARNAVVLAVEEANRRGFSGGVRLELDDLDDAVQGKHDPAQGAQNLRTFVSDPAVAAVVGPMNSNVAEAEIPIANAANLALVSMGATAIDLTKGPAAARLRPEHPERPSFFRVCASDDRQGAAAAAFARGLHLRRAFVVDDNESYGKGIADVFALDFRNGGGTIAGHLTPFALDYKPLLTKIAAEKPDAIFFGGIVSTGGAILRKQMGDVGLGGVPYFGGDGLASPEYAPLAGAEADGTYFTLVAPDVDRLPAARRFVAAYRARFGSEPGQYSAGAYVAAEVAIGAIRAALVPRAAAGAGVDRGAVLEAVAGAHLAVTPVGPVAFDSAGDLRNPIVSLYRVAGGATRFVEQSAYPPK
jgi:branched-chain amino acid transport system substrate-binding protein